MKEESLTVLLLLLTSVSAIEQVEDTIRSAVSEIDDPSFSGLTCTPGNVRLVDISCQATPLFCLVEYLIGRVKAASEALSNATNQFSFYSQDQSGTGLTCTANHVVM